MTPVRSVDRELSQSKAPRRPAAATAVPSLREWQGLIGGSCTRSGCGHDADDAADLVAKAPMLKVARTIRSVSKKTRGHARAAL